MQIANIYPNLRQIRGCLGGHLIGGMDGGMNPKHDFAHELNERGKQELARILLLGSVGKEVIQALGIQKSFQDGLGHHTDRTLLDEGGKDSVQQHSRHLQRNSGNLQLRQQFSKLTAHIERAGC